MDWVIFGNITTDLSPGFFDKSRHAQNDNFVNDVSNRMKYITEKECDGWNREDNARGVLHRMGGALHTLQDFYTHTDWIDGDSLLPVYKHYGDEAALSKLYARRTHPGGHGAFLDLEQIASAPEANKTNYVNLIWFKGGSVGDLSSDPHQRYAADKAGFGRAQAPPEGIGADAFDRAKASASLTTLEFFFWSRENMTASCRCVIYGD